MRRRSLRNFVVRLRLHGMDQIREFDRVLDEENRNIVSDQIPIALLGIHLNCKPANIARRIGRTA